MSSSWPPCAAAQSTENAEARAFFDLGNRAFERSQRATGSVRRQELLEEALAAYVSSLAIVRSKNALFNAGVTLAALGRAAEAYHYFGEYLALPGLTEEEQRAADEQRAALLGRVMMLSVRSTPPGAEVRVDRPDLQPLGRTPLVTALDPGERVLLVRDASGVDRAVQVTAVAGSASEVEVEVGTDVAPEPGAEPEAEGPTETEVDPPLAAESASQTENAPRAEPETQAQSQAEAEPAPAARALSGPRAGLRAGAWSSTAALGLGALALRLRAGRVTRAHDRLAEGDAPLEERVARGAVLYERVVRANRASQALTALSLAGLGVSLGLSVRARRVERARLRVLVSGEPSGLSLGLAGELR